MYTFIDFALLTLIYVYFLYPKWKQLPRKSFKIHTAFYLYLACVCYFTLMPISSSLIIRIMGTYHSKANFIPFIDVIKGRGDYLRQIILNILMTIPFGLFLPILNNSKYNFVKTLIFTLLFSFLIEFLQYSIALGRAFDVTDIITNTFGGIIGYLIYSLIIKN